MRKKSIRSQLHDDHARLHALFQELADTVATADSPTVQALWTEFERGVLTHFELEETVLFPMLEAAHPEEIAGLREEHDRVRTLVADLGVRADLHTLRREVVDRMLDSLSAHAAREDRLLYRWADEIATDELHRTTRERLATARRARPKRPRSERPQRGA